MSDIRANCMHETPAAPGLILCGSVHVLSSGPIKATICLICPHYNRPNDGRAKTKNPRHAATALLLTCPHHGPTARDEAGKALRGEVVRTDGAETILPCGGCHGNSGQTVFQCTLPTLPRLATIADCRACEHRPKSA